MEGLNSETVLSGLRPVRAAAISLAGFLHPRVVESAYESADSESLEFKKLRRLSSSMAAKAGGEVDFKYGAPEDLLITDVGELMSTIGVTLKDEGRISEEAGVGCASYIDDVAVFDIERHQGQAKKTVEHFIPQVKLVLAAKPSDFDASQWEAEVQMVLNELWLAFDPRNGNNKKLTPAGSSIVTKAKKLLPKSGNEGDDEAVGLRRNGTGGSGGSGGGGGGLLAGSSRPPGTGQTTGILRGGGGSTLSLYRLVKNEKHCWTFIPA